jgi:hypothetical protein
MDEHVLLADLGDRREPRVALRVEEDALLSVRPEHDRLVVLERDGHVGPDLFARDLIERPVVEDVAVLVDLHEGRALVGVRPAEHVEHVGPVHVVRAGHEGRLGAERDRQRVERVVERAERRRLGDLAHLRRR